MSETVRLTDIMAAVNKTQEMVTGIASGIERLGEVRSRRT